MSWKEIFGWFRKPVSPETSRWSEEEQAETLRKEAYRAQQAEIAKMKTAHEADLQREISPEHKAPSQSLNRLAVRLLKAHSAAVKTRTAIFPSSIHPVLTMLQAGACGETARQLWNAFEIGESADFQRAYRSFLNQMRDNKDFTLDVINKIWTRPGVRLLPHYGAVLESYGAAHDLLDFGDRELAADTVNRWADESTRHLITHIVRPDQILPDMRSLIGNAVYFKGGWIEPYEREFTFHSPFTPDGLSPLDVPTMSKRGMWRLFRIGRFSAIDLPMKGASVIMLLPDAGVTLDQAIAELPDDALEQIDAALRAAQPAQMDVYVPKFRISTEAYDLAQYCKDLGVVDLFGSSADLSGMSAVKLWLSALLHKTVIEIDEDGASGAALTLGLLLGGSAPSSVDEFRLDRSFLALVRDNRSKAPVAFAKVHNPVGD